MSKIYQKKFDYSSLNIYREINEEIGKLKNIRKNYTYINLPNISKNKNKDNLELTNQNNIKYTSNSKNKKSEEKNQKKIISLKNSNKCLLKIDEPQKYEKYKSSAHISHNNSISKDKERTKKLNNKEKINISKTKFVKKRNFDHVERVVIDLVNKDHSQNSMKNDRIIRKNTYEKDNNPIENKKYNNKSNFNNLRNKENNNSLNDIKNISMAINMIESRWKNNFKSQNEIDLSFLYDEIYKKKREIDIILNRWKENQKIINENKLYIFNDNNITKKWKNSVQIIKEVELNFLLNNLGDKEKDNNNIINKWKNYSQIIKEDNFSFFIDNLKKKENELKNITNRWNNYNQKIKGENIWFIYDNLINKESVDDKNSKKDNDMQIENKISISQDIKDKDSFNYSSLKFINDLVKNIYISENNNNNFYIINQENNSNDLNQINFKVIKPKNKNELELELNNYYNENKNDHNIESYINPIFVLNDEQIKRLNEEFYKGNNQLGIESKKESAEKVLIIEKQMALDYKSVEPNFSLENNKNTSNNLDKGNFENNDKKENNVENKNELENKKYEEFGQSTPLTMLQDKFYVYAVSRINKYLFKSPQSSITFINNYNNIENISRPSFNINRLKINHFSLWIEKIDKIDSNKNSEIIEISENQ